MPWRRKQTRYAWGTKVENDLLNLIKPMFRCIHEKPARACRSSKSGGLFDVWALGHYVWVFQVKRGVMGRRAAINLLWRLHREVNCSCARIFVATRHNIRGRVEWRFFYLEPEVGAVAPGAKAA